MTDTFYIDETVPGHLCVEHGYPNPDTDPVGWINAVRNNVARQVQENARDLDWANDIIKLAIARADYEPPAPQPQMIVDFLEELAAA